MKVTLSPRLLYIIILLYMYSQLHCNTKVFLKRLMGQKILKLIIVLMDSFDDVTLKIATAMPQLANERTRFWLSTITVHSQ